MIKRTCLIIDNEDQSEEIEKLIRDAKNRGIELDCYQFNVGNTAFSEILTNGLIDIEKVVKEFKSRFKDQYFDIIAFDWDLEDERVTGVELIRQLNNKNIAKFSPKIVYSGLLNEVLSRIVQENIIMENSAPIFKNSGITKIKSLVKNRVFDYLDRESRDAMILKFLKEEIQSTELILSQILRKFPDFKFENNFIDPKFNGMSFQEIAVILESEVTTANEFKREIIQQVISYLTETI